jgi:hypothetical protein
MGDLIGDLLRERYGNPPVAEAPPLAAETQGRDDEPTEIARRRRVLWLGMDGEDVE